MKSSEFKQLIKESVREVFREEIKEILLEAVRTPKAVVQESTYRFLKLYKDLNYPKRIISPIFAHRVKQFSRTMHEYIKGENVF